MKQQQWRRPMTWTTIWLLVLCLCSLCVAPTVAESDDSKTTSDTVSTVLDSAKDVKIGPSVAAVIAIVGGIAVCFFGYKLLRPAMFVCGFVLGGLLAAAAVEAIFKNKSWIDTASWVAFAVGGLIVGVLVVMLYNTGIFVAGAAGGVLLAFTLNTSFGHKIYPSNPDVVLIILAVVLGVVGGILACKVERSVLIVATSIVGAHLVVWGVGYFAGDYPSAADLKHYAKQDINGDWVYSIPEAWWGYLAGLVVLSIGGMAAQFYKTSHGEPSRYGAQRRQQAQPHDSAGTPQNQPPYQSSQTPMYGNPVSHV